MVAGGLRRWLGQTGRRLEGQVDRDRGRPIGLGLQSESTPIRLGAVCAPCDMVLVPINAEKPINIVVLPLHGPLHADPVVPWGRAL